MTNNTKLSLWGNAAATENSPVLTGVVSLPLNTARVSLWPNKAAAQNPKAPVLNGWLELSPTYVRTLIAMAQAGQGISKGYQDADVVKLPLAVTPTQPGAGMNGSIELPLAVLQGDLTAGKGLEVINQNTGEQAFRMRLSVWRGDGQNPQAPVLRGSVETPSEREAYLANKGQQQAGAGAWAATPAAPAAVVPGVPGVPAAAPAAAPAAPVPAAAPAVPDWSATPAF